MSCWVRPSLWWSCKSSSASGGRARGAAHPYSKANGTTDDTAPLLSRARGATPARWGPHGAQRLQPDSTGSRRRHARSARLSYPATATVSRRRHSGFSNPIERVSRRRRRPLPPLPLPMIAPLQPQRRSGSAEKSPGRAGRAGRGGQRRHSASALNTPSHGAKGNSNRNHRPRPHLSAEGC